MPKFIEILFYINFYVTKSVINYFSAEMYEELKGEPEKRVDTVTLSLVIAVGVTSLLTVLVTCMYVKKSKVQKDFYKL